MNDLARTPEHRELRRRLEFGIPRKEPGYEPSALIQKYYPTFCELVDRGPDPSVPNSTLHHIWLGKCQRNGQPYFMCGGIRIPVRRFIWLAAVGPVPPGFTVKLLCDNQMCCNTAHLYLDRIRGGVPKLTDRDRARLIYLRTTYLNGQLATVHELSTEFGISEQHVYRLLHIHSSGPG